MVLMDSQLLNDPSNGQPGAGDRNSQAALAALLAAHYQSQTTSQSLAYPLPTSNNRPSSTLAWRKLQLRKAQLKASSRTSALFSGFAMIAMVELQIDSTVHKPLAVAFAIAASALVAVHILALMISTCILPHLESLGTMYNDNYVKESPDEKLSWYINAAWMLSTGMGIVLFLLVIVLQCWIKFQGISQNASICATVIVSIVLIVLVILCVRFYKLFITHKYERAADRIKELEQLKGMVEDV